jgi:porin
MGSLKHQIASQRSKWRYGLVLQVIAVVVICFAYESAVSAQELTCTDLPCGEIEFGDESMACDRFADSPLDCPLFDTYWCYREKLADCGITFSTNFTQFYFGNVSGGVDQTGRYSGHGDYLANVDFGKLGWQEGLFLKVRSEHRFGSSIAPATGALLPATLASELPVPDSRSLYRTNVVFTQMLSEQVGVYAGKLDTLDGDTNAYAGGRGITQFSNSAFVATPLALRAIPYSSLGGGIVFLKDQEPLLNFLVMNPTDTADSAGFDELFEEGVVVSTELRFPTNLMGKPGHQLFGATWNSRDFVSFDQDPRIILPSIPVARTSGTWAFNWNTDQALWVDSADPSRHWGYFARAGFADDSNNPIAYFLSSGLGGASPVRAGDGFGVGYFFIGTSNEVGPLLQAALGPIGDGQGVEVFYRAQVNRFISVTPDFQWIHQVREQIRDAYVLGARMNIVF